MLPVLLAFLALGPAVPVSNNPRLFNPLVAPQTPRAASDGEDFLVVWNRGANAAHVSSSGEVLDRPSLRVTAPPNVRFFDLTRRAGEYVIGWYYFDDSGAVRIRAGTLTSTIADFALPDADINSDVFALASNGTSLAALYRLKSGGYALTFLESQRTIALPSAGEIASDGANFLVLQGTSAVLLASTGDRIATVPLPFTASDVVWDGSAYAIAGTSGDQVEVARVPASGSAGATSIIDRARGIVTGLTIASANGDVAVAWKEAYAGPYPSSPYSVSLQVRSASAHTIDTSMNESVGRFAGWTDPPALASNGRSYLLVWTEGTSGLGEPTRKLFALAVRPGETLSSADVDARKRPVPSSFAIQSDPTSARYGDRLLIAWSEQFSNDASSDARVQIAASEPGGASFLVAPDASQEEYPSAAWDGERTWIVWNRRTGGIVATYVLPDGSRPATPITISDGGIGPRIACATQSCVVIWAENRSHDANSHELFSARLERGALAGPVGGTLIGSGKSFVGVGDYDIASNGTDFEVVWTDRAFYGGAVLHATTGDLAATTTSYASPRIVWNGSQYDVLWNEQSALRGSRLSAAGASLDGDATGWRGVLVADDFRLTDLAAAGGALYAGSTSSLAQIDPATLAIVDTANVGAPVSIAPPYVVYRSDGVLVFRRIGPRARTVR